MRTRRFFALFFSLILIACLSLPAFAAKDDTGDWDILAKAALLIDPETEEILYARNIHERLYPASLTKIMTTAMVLDAVEKGKLSMDTVLTASESALSGLPADGSNAGIKVGEEMTVEDLLYCTMLVSANEACNILGEAVSGSVEAFVADMNTRATLIGCSDTKFANTNGLTDPNHYTTAWDIYLITRYARTYDDFMPLCNTVHREIPATNLSGVRNYYTTNHLLSNWRATGYLYSGAEGIKTGSTSDAGYCLVSSATRGGRSLISIVLGAERITLEDGSRRIESFTETAKLFDWGFDNFSRQVVLSTKELIDEVPVTLSQEADTVRVHPAEEIERLVPNDIDVDKDIEKEWTFTAESFEAPVQRGQVMGQITVSYDGTVYGTVDLLADDDISASKLLVFQRDLQLFFQQPKVKLAIVAAIVLILLIIILIATRGSRRRHYGHGYSGSRRGGYRGRRR